MNSKFKIQNSKFWSGWLFLLPIVLPLYVVRFNIGPLPTTVLEVFVLVSFVIWCGGLVCRDVPRDVSTIKTNPMFRRWALPIIAWLIVTLIAVFIAPDKWAALGHWRAFMLEPILVFVMLGDLLRRTRDDGTMGRGTIIIYGIATVCILLGAYSIVQYFTGWGIPSPWDDWDVRRATGTFGFPNGLSLFMAPFGIVCWIQLIQIQNSKFKIQNLGVNSQSILFLLGTIGAIVAVVLAKSMGGILALGIGIVLTLIINKNTRRVGLAVTVIGLIASGIVGYKILNTQLHPANIGNTIATSKKWSSMVRTVIWQESWQIVKAHPLTGTGLRSYQTALIPFHQAAWMEIYPHPHNIILMLWIETGLLGLLAFIWICFTWISSVASSQSSHHPRDAAPETLSRRACNAWCVALRAGMRCGRAGRATMGRWLWLVPLFVILAHGLVDMPYFKNDLAMQFWILAALASLTNPLYSSRQTRHLSPAEQGKGVL